MFFFHHSKESIFRKVLSMIYFHREIIYVLDMKLSNQSVKPDRYYRDILRRSLLSLSLFSFRKEKKNEVRNNECYSSSNTFETFL